MQKMDLRPKSEGDVDGIEIVDAKEKSTEEYYKQLEEAVRMLHSRHALVFKVYNHDECFEFENMVFTEGIAGIGIIGRVTPPKISEQAKVNLEKFLS